LVESAFSATYRLSDFPGDDLLACPFLKDFNGFLMKKHLIILLTVTLLTRGTIFLSYAPGSSAATADDEAFTHYMIDQMAHGNFLIGNLRYNSGFALVMAPLVSLTRLFGTLQARFIVLVQTILSGLIPFLIYDLVRKRRTPTEALIVALVTALDPLGLEWANLFLPVWLVALCIVLALWLICRAFSSTRYQTLYIFAAAKIAKWRVAQNSGQHGGLGSKMWNSICLYASQQSGQAAGAIAVCWMAWQNAFRMLILACKTGNSKTVS